MKNDGQEWQISTQHAHTWIDAYDFKFTYEWNFNLDFDEWRISNFLSNSFSCTYEWLLLMNLTYFTVGDAGHAPQITTQSHTSHITTFCNFLVSTTGFVNARPPPLKIWRGLTSLLTLSKWLLPTDRWTWRGSCSTENTNNAFKMMCCNLQVRNPNFKLITCRTVVLL